MAPGAQYEQLRCARVRRGEDLAALSARTGLRVHHIRAIEDGRLSDLPPGIYGRAAIRSFASAYALDGDAILAECIDLLPRIEDPIDALARARGLAVTAAARTATAPPRPTAPARVRVRPFAAATVDGAVTGALLLVASAAAALLARVSIHALSSGATPLFLMALILGAGYYLWFGGVFGRTFGEYAVGPEALQRDPRPLTLAAIGLRTLAAATADARAIYGCGVWIGRLTRAGAARTAPPPAPSPSPLPPRGREEVLTWSMNRRASVPPPPLHPRHG